MHVLELALGARRLPQPSQPKAGKIGCQNELAVVSNFIYLSIYLSNFFFYLYLGMHAHMHMSQSSATAVQGLRPAHVPGELLYPGGTSGPSSFPALLYKHHGHDAPSEGSPAAELPVRPQGGQDPLPPAWRRGCHLALAASGYGVL